MKPVLSLSLIALVAGSSLANDVSVKKEIQARYAFISKAFCAKDKATFESAFASDFTASAPGRPKISRQQFFTDFESQMKVLNGVKWVQTIKSLKVEGNIAHVIIDSEMSALVPGKDGKKSVFKLNATDTKADWVKSPQGWMVKSSGTGKLKMSIDGQRLKSTSGGWAARDPSSSIII